ncbi:membrane protein [Streptomyces bingchenggensis BCW-1]|uniref:Membrane protein n=1 Tax=Streptomyces bingchenggensis (strain BCW-1) TaxID=749414 RepID=D7CIA2_STRBB|nr:MULTISPECIES: hypothetical protein [Streptomyces]ADI11280.1 membrane protein [Streptomyces bingchenggensis BCW-1]
MDRDDAWGPPPSRSRALLVPLFLLTVVVLPVWWVLLLAVFLVFLAFAIVGEVLSLVPGFERGFLQLIDSFGGRVEIWPRWCVTLPELLHEGDAGFYQARVDKRLAGWTRKEEAAQAARKAPPPGPYDVPLRDFRGVGAGYVVQAARGLGWELSHDRHSDPERVVRLRRLPVAA